MKNTFWNDEKIRLMCDAVEYLGFTEELAKHCAKWFSADNEIADIGCGLGYLSMDLYYYVQKVTAIDINEDVLNYLKVKSEERKLKIPEKLEIIQADAFEDLEGNVMFDGMVASFFGQIPQLLDFTKHHVRDNAVWIRKNWDTHRFSAKPTQLTRLRFKEDCAELKRLGIPFHTELFQLEMGQPLQSAEDGKLFFELYSREEKPAISEEEVRSRLIPIIHEKYKYMFSCIREVGVIIVSADDVRRRYG